MEEKYDRETVQKTTPDSKQKKVFFITTAISYTNGLSHIGHAYESILADVLVRWHRLMGREVFFSTGTDEHGQKIAKTAQDQKITPKELCDKHVESFKNLNNRLNISFDTFIRTTDEVHKKTAQKIFQACLDNKDIYEGVYRGWYNRREEQYITELEAKATDYKDFVSGDLLERVDAPSYFFRMDKYRDKLVSFLKSHPDFIRDPQGNHILKRLEEPLLDLSISRVFDWGIPIPNTDHVMYVWFDALTNYLSASDYFTDDKWWKSETIHIIGKDILWFHAVIWPCMLMSANIELPKQILVHGFVTDSTGNKMSKSLKNVIEPFDLLDQDKFTSDEIRYYFVRETSCGSDLKFSKEGLQVRKDELAHIYGNLITRTFALLETYCDSKIPSPCPLWLNTTKLLEDMDREMLTGEFRETLGMIVDLLQDTNGWLQKQAPWEVSAALEYRSLIVRELLERVLFITWVLKPFIPSSTDLVLKRFNCATRLDLNLVEGTSLCCDKLILFPTKGAANSEKKNKKKKRRKKKDKGKV